MLRISRTFAALSIGFGVTLAILALQHSLGADQTAQALPILQNWADTNRITLSDNWDGVPGIVGYRGDALTAATGIDPQTVLSEGTPVVDVNANRSDPNLFATGGVTEFDGIVDPTIALQGSGTARAPHIVINAATLGFSGISVSYNLRDIDGSSDNSVQPVALQFRVGASGNFTNIPAGFVADASSGPGQATLVTPVSATLPAAADNQPLVQIRIITADAVGSDEWIGIDDIVINGGVTTNPSASALATPNVVQPGAATLLTATVSPGANPPSTGIAVAADLTAIGGSATQTLFDDGIAPDATAGDNIFSYLAVIPFNVSPGAKPLPVAVRDDQNRTAGATIALTVTDAPAAEVVQPPYLQNWSDTAMIAVDDNWHRVPGIVGYRGDALTASTGVDPQTVLAEGTPIVDVNANRTNPDTFTTGGVTEFQIGDPTIALAGSGTARAPNLVLQLDTTGKTAVLVSYDLRDIDGSTDNAIQPVALQYRLGQTGLFTNIPAAFVPDATTGPGLANQVTPVSVLLPSILENQPLVQLRIITTDAAGSDEWVGVDNIQALAGVPVGAGAAAPSIVAPGAAVLLTVAVTPGATPPSTGLAVIADLSAIGGSSSQVFFDDGTGGDATARDNVFSFQAVVAANTSVGPKTLTGTVGDAELRASHFAIFLTVEVPAPFYTINQIQGEGSRSPLAGLRVQTRGVITGIKTNGFFLQSQNDQDDANPQTSEGIFVFTAPGPAGVVGNLVGVTGLVQEFVPGADVFQPPITEIAGSPQVTLLQTGAQLPAPIKLTAGDTPPGGGLDVLERLEGMRVLVGSLLVTAPTQGFVNEPNATSTSNGVFYGVISGVDRPFCEPGIQEPDPLPPGAPPAVPRFDGNPERLRVDSDGLVGAQIIDVASGDEVLNLVGPLDYSFRTYQILPDPATAPAVVRRRRSPTPVATPTAAQFTVASANLERFFDTVNDPQDDAVLTQTAFANRLNKVSLYIRDILQTPDIVAVEEVENLATLQAVASKINSDAAAAGSPNPNYAAYLVEGNDIGGIDSGFLVKQARAEVVDVIQEGAGSTYIDPNTGDPALLNDRPPLVVRAIIHTSGSGVFPITAIVNHLRSLNSVDDPADGNRVRTKRRAQAEFLAGLIQARQLANPDEHIISVGDYNAFQFNDGYVDSLGTIKGAPSPSDQVTLASTDLVNPDLVNVIDLMPAEERYSFVFDGNAQVLDHHLITQNLLGLFDHAEFGRANADFPEPLRNDPNSPERISDHDGLVTFFTLPGLFIDDVTVSEGNSGTTAATFTVSLSAPSTGTVTVNFTTADGTAFAGPDYVARAGTVVFSPGEVTKHITIDVAGDVVNEAAAEIFLVNLSNPVNALIGDGQGVGTILDDDASLSIGDVTVTEPDSGSVSAVFTVRLPAPSALAIAVDFATASGTATAGSDFAAASGMLRFAPGETEKTVAVTVFADHPRETVQTFFVNLSNPVNARIGDAAGTGTIFDAAAPQIDGFSPAAATVGSVVTITGGDFTAVTSVKFNGVPAAFSMRGVAKILAIVPPGAGDGPISVSNASGTGTSATPFDVVNAPQ